MVKTASTRGLAVLLVLGGCFDVRSREPGFEIRPDELGRVTLGSNDLGIQGFWYAYGDQYDCPSRCTQIGKHSPDECSQIITPAHLPTLEFHNTNGEMCTSGRVAQIVTKRDDCELCDKKMDPDYWNIWGAGIGLDFGLDVSASKAGAFVRRPIERTPWDANAHNIVAVSFDFRWLAASADGATPLRVEFPFMLPATEKLPPGKGTVGLDVRDCTSAVVPPDETSVLPFPDQPTPTEEHPSGSPIWGVKKGSGWTDPLFSPVHEGYNEVPLKSLDPPPDAFYAVDLSKLLGIQFHVPTSVSGPRPYSFCISNLVLLRQ